MTVVLGIETSCDETAIGIVKDGKEILCNIYASHIDIHETFGGVFPEMSSRRHFDLLLPTIKKSLSDTSLTFDDIDLIAVANRPGLMGSLLMGVNVAKTLAYSLNIPIVGVNHLEAHLYGAMMSEKDFTTPSIGLIASGGHTSLLRISSLGSYTVLGNTLDDAVGEAFDKVGRLLNLTYPAGPKIEQLAKSGSAEKFPFKRKTQNKHPYNFSYSGLKTQALYMLKGQNGNSKSETIIKESDFKDFAASFQECALLPLVKGALLACENEGLTKIYVGGGVSNNQRFREIFSNLKNEEISVVWPKSGLSLDNGAMIAGLGHQIFIRAGKIGENLSLSAIPTIKSLSI